MHVKWYNMYGAPEFKQGNLVDNVAKIGQGIQKGVEVSEILFLIYYDLYG